MKRNISHTDKSDSTLFRREARRLVDLILALGRQSCLRDPMSSTAEAMQFTHSQAHTLMWLGFDGPLTMGEIARRGGVTEKTVTGVIDRLERDGWLQRERDAEDRRVIRVRLTPKGIKTFRHLRGRMYSHMERLLALLDANDRRDVFRIIGKIGDRFGEIMNPPARMGARER